jgi:hypothetical protein
MDSNLFGYLIPIILGGIFAVLGIGLLAFGLRERKKAKETERWPIVDGKIIVSRMDQQTRTERDEGHTQTRTVYSPIVEYTYDIGGKTYHGNRIFPGSTLSYDLGTAQGIVNRYQPESTVKIHYDPSDPTKAVLETQSKGGKIFLIIGIVFAILGIIGCCVGVIVAAVSQSG